MNSRVSGHIEDIPGRAMSVKSFQVGLWSNGRDTAHPLQTLVPAIATKDSPYIVIGDDFSQPYHEGAPDNSCTSCHKPQCDDLFAVKLGELAMPGPFNNHDHVIGVTPDLQELRDWCGTIP